MRRALTLWDRATAIAASPCGQGVALLFVRVALAGVFWRSGRSKVAEGTWLTVSDTTHYLFGNDYSGVPLPPAFAAQAATLAEFVFPILLVLGLATRFAALALLGMTLVIQIFVYPEAWWSVHVLWVALALVILSQGAGMFALDTPLAAKVRR